MRPEGDLGPEVGEERPVVRRDARASEGADGQACRQHGDHTRYVEEPLGRYEGKISKRYRQRRFGEPIIAGPRHGLEQGTAEEGSQNAAAEERGHELDGATSDV